MSQENTKTIEVYEKCAERYLGRSTVGKIEKIKQEMLKNCLADLPKEAKIFEVGSASGNDAIFFRSLGYQNITVSDVVKPFLKKLEEEGFSPLRFNIIKDSFPDKYVFIYCWAVLMHLTKDEAKSAIKKIYNALNNDGMLLTCVKTTETEKEKWSDFENSKGEKVYFSFWSENELEQYLKEIGFRAIKIWKYNDWIDCLAKK